MTEVSFHFNVADPRGYACRLLRKAVRKGARIVVTAPAETLASLDKALWSFDPLEFLPHVLLRPGERPAERLLETPVWLAAQSADAPHHEVLLNLGDAPPQGFESFERVIELVSRDDAARAAGRDRWRHYAGRGYAIQKHEVAE